MIHPPYMKVSKIRSLLPSLSEEREEELKRLRLKKMTGEAEQRRLAVEYEQRKNQRIIKEIEERAMEEAQALLEEEEKCIQKKGKRNIRGGKTYQADLDGVDFD